MPGTMAIRDGTTTTYGGILATHGIHGATDITIRGMISIHTHSTTIHIIAHTIVHITDLVTDHHTAIKSPYKSQLCDQRIALLQRGLIRMDQTWVNQHRTKVAATIEVQRIAADHPLVILRRHHHRHHDHLRRRHDHIRHHLDHRDRQDHRDLLRERIALAGKL